MKKRIPALLLALVLSTLALTGCGRQPDTAQPPLETVSYSNLTDDGSRALLTAALPACSFLDTDPQIIPDDGYYNSEQKLIYGLAGVYGVLNSEALYGNYYSLQIANADDLCYFNNYNNSESRPDRYNHSAGTAAICACCRNTSRCSSTIRTPPCPSRSSSGC